MLDFEAKQASELVFFGVFFAKTVILTFYCRNFASMLLQRRHFLLLEKDEIGRNQTLFNCIL